MIPLLVIAALSGTVFAQPCLLSSSAQGDSAKPLDPMPADADPSLDVATIKPSDTSALHGTTFRSNGRHEIASNTSDSELFAHAYGLHAKHNNSAVKSMAS